MPPPAKPEEIDSSLLYEEAPCALVRADASGLLLQVNGTFCSWFGYASDELVGRVRFQDLLNVGGRIFYQTHIGPLLELQGSVAEVKFDLKHRDGHLLPILANIVDRPDTLGRVRQIAVFIAKDRAKYELELVRARQRAEDLRDQLTQAREIAEDRALLAEQMVGIVSHDLRNPLMAVTLGAEAIGSDPVTPRQQRLLGQMALSVNRASRLIGDLLDFTQARVGRGIRVNPAPIDLHACTAEALAELRLAWPQRRLIHLKEGPAPQRADGDRIAQFIGNLVANAIAYGDPTQPITVTSIGAQDGFEIRVHNHGTPIPEELLGKIFEPMTRGEAASEGIGLGLFIVNRIVNAHGGRVDVLSSSSGGTTFRGHFSAGVVTDD